MMCLSRIAYIQLCNHFKQKRWIEYSRHATVEEKIAIFLPVISHNDRFIKVKNRFQHSTETFHRYFHEVLNGMMEFANEVIGRISYDRNNHLSRRYKELLKIFSVSKKYRILDIFSNTLLLIMLIFQSFTIYNYITGGNWGIRWHACSCNCSGWSASSL
ncbi:hypothetical protein DCAR_0206793 [Daucus carota subsp. sativus]|uniref:DUF8040 domain-containing protein n=1 Tax=Daucus carota subsp. sativus TaxID=79200 RepID=A0AAF0WED1_DAUCS|nr:hypothetical protein DCAR_0206793 [Daucus carota subsp. sativus]